MKMLFENRYEWTVEDTKKIYYLSMMKSTKYKVAFFLLALAVVFIVTLFVLYNKSAMISITLGICLIIIVSAVIISFMKQSRLINIEYAQLLKKFGGKAPVLTVRVSGEALTSQNGSGKGGGVYFDDILYAKEDKTRFILASRTREIYVIKKDFFTKGNAEDFKEFLINKGIKIK